VDQLSQCGTIVAATHFCQKWALGWPAYCVLARGEIEFHLAAIEM